MFNLDSSLLLFYKAQMEYIVRGVEIIKNNNSRHDMFWLLFFYCNSVLYYIPNLSHLLQGVYYLGRANSWLFNCVSHSTKGNARRMPARCRLIQMYYDSKKEESQLVQSNPDTLDLTLTFEFCRVSLNDRLLLPWLHIEEDYLQMAL